METAEGTVSGLQNTIRVTGGGNTQATTTYIALFRLDGKPVQFNCPRPVAIVDGDRLKAVGSMRAAGLLAYACRDLTTGATMHSGIWGNVVMAVVLPLFGAFFCGILWLLIGKYALLVYALFLAGAIYLACRAVMTAVALGRVRQ